MLLQIILLKWCHSFNACVTTELSLLLNAECIKKAVVLRNLCWIGVCFLVQCNPDLPWHTPTPLPYMFISIKTPLRFVCVCNTLIHLFYILSMVIPQITDRNDITELVSVHMCARVYMPHSHDPSRWKWLFFLIPLALFISFPSHHPFVFARHCMTYLNSGRRLNLPGAPAAVLHVRQVGLCASGLRSRALVFSYKFSH